VNIAYNIIIVVLESVAEDGNGTEPVIGLY